MQNPTQNPQLSPMMFKLNLFISKAIASPMWGIIAAVAFVAEQTICQLMLSPLFGGMAFTSGILGLTTFVALLAGLSEIILRLKGINQDNTSKFKSLSMVTYAVLAHLLHYGLQDLGFTVAVSVVATGFFATLCHLTSVAIEAYRAKPPRQSRVFTDEELEAREKAKQQPQPKQGMKNKKANTAQPITPSFERAKAKAKEQVKDQKAANKSSNLYPEEVLKELEAKLSL